MKNIVVIFGGNSLEHEISLKTGYSIGKELFNSKLYKLFFIGILKNGQWKYDNNIDNIIINTDKITTIKINEACCNIHQIGNGMINNIKIDKAFLATHGKIGEDGNLQGFLTVNNIPFTGNDVNGSVVCFNKNICKYIAELHKINVAPYICLNKYDFKLNDPIFNQKLFYLLKPLGNKFIVKINRGGSSIGVYTCNHITIVDTITKAFELDDFIIIEKELLNIHELSIGIMLKNDELIISDIKEIPKYTNANFMSFEEKYLAHPKDSVKINPINILLFKNKITQDSITLYKKLNLKSYVRIDFFVDEQKSLYFNEINNLPGLSNLSIFYKLWNKKFTYLELLSFIIDL